MKLDLSEFHVSTEGRKLIKRFEGCRLKAYRCPAGILTIGYGHTSAAGEPKVYPGMAISESLADGILAKDLVKYENGVKRLLKVYPTQGQFDALVSFAYNCGEGRLAGSSILARYNRRDFHGAAAAFNSYCKGGGVVLQGLKTRRKAEAALFLREDHAEVHALLDSREFEKSVDDEGGMAQETDTLDPPKSVAESKTAISSVIAGGAGIGGIIEAGSTAVNTAQTAVGAATTAKDTAVNAVSLLGSHPWLIVSVAVIVCATVFIIYDRWTKLHTDGV